MRDEKLILGMGEMKRNMRIATSTRKGVCLYHVANQKLG